MVSKMIPILACFAVQAGAARVRRIPIIQKAMTEDNSGGSLIQQSEDAMGPSLSEMKPGTQVAWTSSFSGKSYDALVKEAKLMPMVKVDYKSGSGTKTKWVPLEEIDLKDDERKGNTSGEHEGPASGGAVDNLNLRQKIVCDVCLSKLSSCVGYRPSPGMLNPVRPPPESPNGRYFTCPPSERELWSTDDRFKVLEDGTPGEGDRSKCPSERRTAPVNGKLGFARRICKLATKRTSSSDCSSLVNDVAGVFGRSVTCSRDLLFMYN